MTYPLIILNLFDYFMRYVKTDPSAPPIARILEIEHDVLILVGVMQVVFLVITFMISIFVSHRIAGPLYKLGMFFKKARDGNLAEKLQFRRTDYFHEVADGYNEMMEKIRTRGGAIVAVQPTEAILRIERILENIPPELHGSIHKELGEVLNSLKGTPDGS